MSLNSSQGQADRVTDGSIASSINELAQEVTLKTVGMILSKLSSVLVNYQQVDIHPKRSTYMYMYFRSQDGFICFNER